MTTTAVPLLWQYHARSLASAGQWPLRIALIAPVVIAALSILLTGGDADTYSPWFSDTLLPVLGSLTVIAALLPEMRSGALRTWAAAPDRAGFRWLLQRSALALAGMAVLVLAGMLLGTLVNLLLGIMFPPVFLPGFFVGYFFMGALTLAGTLLFRHPIGGVALALAYWLVDLRLGAAGNPLLTLHATAAELDRQGNPVTRLLNKPALVLLAVTLLASCAYALPRLLSPVNPREAARSAGLLLGGLLVLVIAQAVIAVGLIYATRGPTAPLRRVAAPLQGARRIEQPKLRPTNLRQLTAPMEKFEPLPASLLFGPVYHGLVNLPPANVPVAGQPTSGTQSPEGATPRITALTRLVKRYGAWPWADTAAHELAVARSAVDGLGGLKDYWNLAQRYPNSPYAADALATIMNTSEVWIITEKSPNSRAAGSYDRFFHTMPLQPRLGAAVALLQRYPNAAASADARDMVLEYYPALIRPEIMLTVAPKAAQNTRGFEKAHWLTILAEIDVNRGRFAEAEKTAKQAREELGRSGAPGNPDDEHVGHHLGNVEQLLELWRSKQQAEGGR